MDNIYLKLTSKYCLNSDEICGLYPHKLVDMEFSKRADILRQAANRVVSGETTFSDEVFTISYYMFKYNRLKKPTSKKQLIVDLRRLIKKADKDKKFSCLYKHIHKSDAAIIKILESAYYHVHRKADYTMINIRKKMYERAYAKKQKLATLQRTNWEESLIPKIENLESMEDIGNLADDEHLSEVEHGSLTLPLTLPPVSPAMPSMDMMEQLANHNMSSHTETIPSVFEENRNAYNDLLRSFDEMFDLKFNDSGVQNGRDEKSMRDKLDELETQNESNAQNEKAAQHKWVSGVFN